MIHNLPLGRVFSRRSKIVLHLYRAAIPARSRTYHVLMNAKHAEQDVRRMEESGRSFLRPTKQDLEYLFPFGS